MDQDPSNLCKPPGVANHHGLLNMFRGRCSHLQLRTLKFKCPLLDLAVVDS